MDHRRTMQVSGAILVFACLVVVLPHLLTPEHPASAGPYVVLKPPSPPPEPPPAPLDTAAYDAKLRQLAHLETAPESTTIAASPWPANAAYPLGGALLPFNRIVAYYGNFYSTGMGVLGKYAPDVMVDHLLADVKKWQEADPTTPVIPGIDYIAVTAQARPGDDGKYRARMPDSEIQKALALADRVHGVVILEVQPGLSDLLTEVKVLEPYLSLPNVQLAIDPEFVMATSKRRPGSVVGTVDAKVVNAVASYLASLVQDKKLPPKFLVVHRYTQFMVTHVADIKPLPEVEIVMDMDGWGPPSQKLDTYQAYIASQPVQFTGFKLFYVNDLLRVGSRMLTPAEILKLTPSPSFIQYQ